MVIIKMQGVATGCGWMMFLKQIMFLNGTAKNLLFFSIYSKSGT